MKISDLFSSKSKESRSAESTVSSWFGGSLMYNGNTSYHQNKALMHSAVFRCIDLLSNSIGELPVVVTKVMEDGYKEIDMTNVVYKLLNKKPNKRMNKNTFFRMVVSSMVTTGNAYAYIKRNSNNEIEELQYIPSDMVQVISKNVFDEVRYQVTGIKNLIDSKDMLHFINIADRDGIRGISTLQYAKKVLTLGFDELDTADSFYRSGGNKAGCIKSEKPVTDEQKEQILSRWQQTFNGSNGIPNGVVILNPGQEYQPIQISPADAELLESRKFTVLEICRFFGVSPSMVFDNSNNSYSSVEAENLAFLTNTLAPLLDKIETELNNKLWMPYEENYSVKFDTSVLMRTDKSALADYYTKLFNLSVLSPNEIRRDLDLAPIEGGDKHFMQVNISTIDKIANQDLQDNENISNQLKDEED